MSCQFSLDFPGTAAESFAKVQSLMTQNGGTISGNANSGSFILPIPVVGNIKGSYAIVNQTVTITITDKPLFIGCSTIESTIRSKL